MLCPHNRSRYIWGDIMIIDDQHYDVIIIGSGAGGGTLAHKLAPTGKRILILERGESMLLEDQNRADVDLFKKERYHAPEQWYDDTGEPFYPQTNYAVGGNTKIYGATLMRLRDRDFEAVPHQDGTAPAWPLNYADFEPYYTAAEQLYQVHGSADNDPTEPSHSEGYPFPEVDHDPLLRPVVEALSNQGLHPTAIPMSLTRQDDDPTGDAEVFGVVPALKYDNVTLMTGAKVISLHTNTSGKVIKGVQAEVGDQSFRRYWGASLRRSQLRCSAAGLRQREASYGSCQWLRPGGPQPDEAVDDQHRPAHKSV